MQKLLTLALLLCASLLHSEAACFFKTLKPGDTHCQDPTDKTWHAVGSSWRNSECLDCTCFQCCQAYMTPIGLPDDCEKEFDKINCKYNVFKKNDPNQSCPYAYAVGK
ncbi:beta-microseminoprotein-like [Brienomyrus brachyistius]|uniref:beta-microseminoprotein-like n=1 Tax=Brienomyrus brachyistius TaxID=42636 RepID=UPI0020B2A626|nr:beta-microseminoprotein-like [Brienomyrus brachyistius]